MNLVLPATLLGDVELRNEEVLLPQDARELYAQNAIREKFGNDWGKQPRPHVLVSPSISSPAVRLTDSGVAIAPDADGRDGELNLLFDRRRRYPDRGIAYRSC